MKSSDRSGETNHVDCLCQLLQQAREALAKHDKATACITEVEPNADGAVSIPGEIFHALGGCMGAGSGSAFVRQPDGKFASRRYRVFVSDHAIAEDLSQLITVCGANFPRGIYDQLSIKPDRDAEGMFYAVLFATAESHLIEELTHPQLPKPWRLIRSPFLAVVRCLQQFIENDAGSKKVLQPDKHAGAEDQPSGNGGEKPRPRHRPAKRDRKADKPRRTAPPEEREDLDQLLEALNAPVEWPPLTVVDELKELGERQRPGFKEEVENEKCRLHAVPLPVLIRQNNANSANPGDPKELEIMLEKDGHYTPAHLLMELEYYRYCPRMVPGGDKRALCEDQHNRALQMRELDPSLSPVPAYTDNPVVDEKALRQWCIDAQAKPTKTPRPSRRKRPKPTKKPKADEEAQAPAKPKAGGKVDKPDLTGTQDKLDDPQDKKAPPPNWSKIMSKAAASRRIGVSVDKIDDHLSQHPEAIHQISRQCWQFDKNRPLFSRLP